MTVARLTSLTLVLLAVGTPFFAQTGYKPGFGWPAVTTPFYHAANPGEAVERLIGWRQQTGFSISGYQDTGSMRPVLRGGREFLAKEICRPDTPLVPGQIVEFNRGDLPAVLHYIADVSRDGSHVYLSGVGNRHSDGWFHRDAVRYVVREIVTMPEQTPMTIAAQTTVAAPAIAGEAR